MFGLILNTFEWSISDYYLILNYFKSSYILNLLLPIFPFDPSENIKKHLDFWFSQGNQKGTLKKG